MAQQETVTPTTPDEARRQVDRRPNPPDRRRPDLIPSTIPSLPAGIRWWEACGGWTTGYALGVF